MSNFIRFLRHVNWLTLKKTVVCAAQRRLTGLAAEMAFQAMLGLFPAIIAVITAISLFEASIKSTLAELAIRFADIVPRQVWQLLLDFIQEVKLSQGRSWFSLSFIAAIWIFSGVLSAAMNALDQIHQVEPEAKRTFWQAKIVAILLTIGTIVLLIVASFLLIIGDFLLQIAAQQNWGELILFNWKIFSIIIIFVIIAATISLIFKISYQQNLIKDKERKSILITIIIAVSLMLNQIVYYFYNFIKDLIINTNIEQTITALLVSVWRLLSFPIALGIVAIAFGFIYRFGASNWRKKVPIMPGAILAAISWAVVSGLFRLYVSHFGHYNKIYGAVGAVIVLMLWLYLSSLVMLLGDQLNAIVGETMETKLKGQKSNHTQ